MEKTNAPSPIRLLAATRVFFSLIAIGVMSFGIWMDHRLILAGIHSMTVRSLVSFPLSYAFFFCLLSAWVRFFRSEIEKLGHEDALLNVRDKEARTHEWERTSKLLAISAVFKLLDKIPRLDSNDNSPLAILDVFFFGIYLIGLALALLVSAYWGIGLLISEGGMILVDALFNAVLTSILLRKYRKTNWPNWDEEVFKRTWLPFLILWLLSSIVLLLGEDLCPSATRFSKVLECVAWTTRS